MIIRRRLSRSISVAGSTRLSTLTRASSAAPTTSAHAPRRRPQPRRRWRRARPRARARREFRRSQRSTSRRSRRSAPPACARVTAAVPAAPAESAWRARPTTLANANTRTRSSANAAAADAARATAPRSVSVKRKRSRRNRSPREAANGATAAAGNKRTRPAIPTAAVPPSWYAKTPSATKCAHSAAIAAPQASSTRRTFSFRPTAPRAQASCRARTTSALNRSPIGRNKLGESSQVTPALDRTLRRKYAGRRMATPDQLTRLGLTSYEAKAYLALVRRDSSTAAQVARLANVSPGSASTTCSRPSSRRVSPRRGRARWSSTPRSRPSSRSSGSSPTSASGSPTSSARPPR